jgi:malonyl CoA-acyl carrier protein transacylase
MMISRAKSSGRLTSCRSRFTTQRMVSVMNGLLEVLFQPVSFQERISGVLSSITRSITEQIFTLPLHWTKAIDFPETATHAIDFGPGGANGVGPIVSRILSGRGVRVIVLGDKSKGDELYDSKTSSTRTGGARSGHHVW